ncbi:MAG TPA: DUF6776 family protein [Gammaproteobacteria bacterium]
MKIQEPTHVIVKSHNPARKPLLVILVLAIAGITGSSLYEYGRFRGGFDSAEAKRERNILQARIEEQEDERIELARQNEILLQGKDIDRHAYAEIDQSLAELQSEILELKEEVAFYRGVVGSAEEVRGLQVRNFKLIKDGQTQGYRYRLILTQFVRNNRFVSGRVNLAVSGIQEGIDKQLTQGEFVKQVPENTKFRFKYFQELKGEIVFPEGFIPLKITLSIIPQDDSQKPVEKIFNWSEVMT